MRKKGKKERESRLLLGYVLEPFQQGVFFVIVGKELIIVVSVVRSILVRILLSLFLFLSRCRDFLEGFLCIQTFGCLFRVEVS